MIDLSPREKQVLEGLKLGHSAKIIGEKLKISPLTVKVFKNLLFTKMGVHSSLAAVAKAAKDGL